MKNSEFLLNQVKDGAQQEMQLFDYCVPTLLSGTYYISTDQTITWTERNVAQTYSKSQPFMVQGPRFAIDGAIVYGLFPPAAGTGQYESALPTIVLNRRTLPWERTISDTDASSDPPIPWIALMVFTEDEVQGT